MVMNAVTIIPAVDLTIPKPSVVTWQTGHFDPSSSILTPSQYWRQRKTSQSIFISMTIVVVSLPVENQNGKGYRDR